MTVTEAQEALQTAYDDAVAQAVADGVITQAQADQLAEMQVLRDGLGHGGRGGHGHGGCRGGFDDLSGGQAVPGNILRCFARCLRQRTDDVISMGRLSSQPPFFDPGKRHLTLKRQ